MKFQKKTAAKGITKSWGFFLHIKMYKFSQDFKIPVVYYNIFVLGQEYFLSYIQIPNQWRIQDFQDRGANLKFFQKLKLGERLVSCAPCKFANANGSVLVLWAHCVNMACATNNFNCYVEIKSSHFSFNKFP